MAGAQAILYVKYKEEKLMEHLKHFFARMNIPRVIREVNPSPSWNAPGTLLKCPTRNPETETDT